MKKPWLVWTLLAGFAALAGVAASLAVLHQPRTAIRSGTLLDKRRPVKDFSLAGSDGQAYTRANLGGHWSLLYIGYTYCPDVCPTTLALLKTVYAGLGADAAKLQVNFISIDPERDTPERLGQYVHYFNPAFNAATGSNAQLDSLGADLGFVYAKVPGATPQSYLMDHSSALILIDPQARLAGYLTPPFKTVDLTADLKTLLEQPS